MLMTTIQKILHFFQKDIWEKQQDQSRFYKALRVVISAFQGFIKDKGFDKASLLTFYTLLTIIPFLAIGFGIAQELGFADKLSQQIKTQFQEQPEVAQKLIEFANSTLKTTKGSIIASFGIVILLWTVLRTITNVELFFNAIWKVKTPRTFWVTLRNYIPLILLFPIFLVVSNGLLIYLSTLTVAFTKGSKFLSFLSPIFFYFFHFVNYFVSFCFLSFLYIYLPNTKVSWKAGFMAGVITGIVYIFWEWIYVTFQLKATSYGAIYGGFAAVPLFLIWLNYSWLIIIFGAELCYHIEQNDIQKH